jgi:hypothetical protein
MENNTLTYQQIINAIQLQALNDPTPPASGTQEFQIYGQMIATLAIPTWENERGTLWNELWVEEPAYATIAVQSGVPQSISLPNDFKFIGDGCVWVNYPGGTVNQPATRSFPVKRIEEKSLNNLQSRPEFYVIGNAVTGFSLVTGWIPQKGDAEIGATISFRYYKHANVPTFDTNGNITDVNDSPEMSDPTFIIYKVAAQVNAANYNMNLYQIFEDKANYSLLQMRMANDMPSNFQDDYIKDIDGLTQTGYGPVSKYNSGYWTRGGF